MSFLLYGQITSCDYKGHNKTIGAGDNQKI